MMWKRLRKLSAELVGNRDERFVGHLHAQLEHATAAAKLAASTIEGRQPAAEVRIRIEDVEHEGDRARGELVEELAMAITTPIDREDLFRLSRSIDDILDNLRDFAIEVDLYGVVDDTLFAAPLEAIVATLERLEEGVGHLADRPTELGRSALLAKKGSNQVRKLYQAALARLFDGEVTVGMLKRRELLRRLDVVGLRCGEAADALADGAVKRSH